MSLPVAFSSLHFDIWSVRLSISMDHFFSVIWFLKNNYPCARPSSWLSGKTSECQERYWYSLPVRAPRNRSSAHLYFYWFRCTIQFWNSLHFILKKLCRLTFFLFANRVAIRGLIRFYVRSKIFLRLSRNFWMQHDLVSLSIWNSLSSLCVNISLGAGENLTIWLRMRLTIPAELWGLITRNLVYRWGLLLAGGVTEKEIISLCCLFTCAWIFPTSAVHFLAFASLAITLWFKEGVITGGIEGLMSSGAVTIVTGTLSRMRNTFCWSPHEHLVSLRTPHH